MRSESYARYLAYRPSGVKWLGDVPETWEVRRLKTLCSMKSGDGITAESIETTGAFPVYGGNGLRGYASNYTHEGAFALIGRQGALCGNVHIARGQFWASEHAVVASLQPGHVLEWFGSVLQTMNLNQYSIAAAQPGLAAERILNLWLPVPPLDEQRAIARYLGYVDERIGRYVRAKEKLIGLQEEEKQAIINQAVTRGLDPSVRLKPSGVEGLGDVPEHWEVRRLRYLVEGRLNYGANAAADYDNPAWPRYLRITDFDLDGRIRMDTFRSLPPSIAEEYLVRPGDLLFARSGATVGKSFLVSGDAGKSCYAGYLIRARPRKTLIDPQYLFAFTKSFAFLRWKDSTHIIATIQNISAEKYANLSVPVPSLSEQSRIMSYLNSITATSDAAIDRARRQIELLEEYRTRLIADVVTGKLDVREAAAGLPDEAEAMAKDSLSVDGVDEDLRDADGLA